MRQDSVTLSEVEMLVWPPACAGVHAVCALCYAWHADTKPLGCTWTSPSVTAWGQIRSECFEVITQKACAALCKAQSFDALFAQERLHLSKMLQDCPCILVFAPIARG